MACEDDPPHPVLSRVFQTLKQAVLKQEACRVKCACCSTVHKEVGILGHGVIQLQIPVEKVQDVGSTLEGDVQHLAGR